MKPIAEQGPFLTLHRVDDPNYFKFGFGGDYKLGFPHGKPVFEVSKNLVEVSNNSLYLLTWNTAE